MSGEPISLTGCVECDPGLYVLPIRYYQEGAGGPPRLAEYWQWVVPAGAAERPRWVRVVVVGQ